MATIRKRSRIMADGEERVTWLADYTDQHGGRHNKTFTNKKAATAWLVMAQGEVAAGTHTPEAASITVAKAAELWLKRGEREKLERSTLKQYSNHVRLHINPLIGNVRLGQLSAPMVVAFRNRLLEQGAPAVPASRQHPCSRAMTRKVLASLKGVLGEAQQQGLVAQNVALRVRVTVKKREEAKLVIGRDIPSKGEAQAILQAADGRWRPLFVTAIFTGMRSSELRGLLWQDVDFERGAIHVRQRADYWNVIGAPKSAAGDREIPMAPPVVNALRVWRLACPKQSEKQLGETAKARAWLVFPNGAGKIESHANIANRGLYAIQLKMGMVKPNPVEKDKDGNPVMRPKYGMHALRHFFASWAIEQGFSAKRLQGYLGHSSMQMTFDVYGHLFPSTDDDHAKFAAGALALVR
jgi:integrase